MKVYREKDYINSTLNIPLMHKRFLITALNRTNGNQTKSAEMLGVTSRTVVNMMKQHSVEWVKGQKIKLPKIENY